MKNHQSVIHQKTDDITTIPKWDLNLTMSVVEEYPSYVTDDPIGRHEAFERKFADCEHFPREHEIKKVITDALCLLYLRGHHREYSGVPTRTGC